MFRSHRIARSSTTMFLDLLLACLVNTTCAIINIMANLIFTIVSLSVTCILSCCSCPLISLHALVGIAVILLFQHCGPPASVPFSQCYLRYYKYYDYSNLHHSHCLSVACILCCCSCCSFFSSIVLFINSD